MDVRGIQVRVHTPLGAVDIDSPLVGAHNVENLLCADSSVFVTSTGYGPTLTLAALAHRTASLVVGAPAPSAARPAGHER